MLRDLVGQVEGLRGAPDQASPLLRAPGGRARGLALSRSPSPFGSRAPSSEGASCTPPLPRPRLSACRIKALNSACLFRAVCSELSVRMRADPAAEAERRLQTLASPVLDWLASIAPPRPFPGILLPRLAPPRVDSPIPALPPALSPRLGSPFQVCCSLLPTCYKSCFFSEGPASSNSVMLAAGRGRQGQRGQRQPQGWQCFARRAGAARRGAGAAAASQGAAAAPAARAAGAAGAQPGPRKLQRAPLAADAQRAPTGGGAAAAQPAAERCPLPIRGGG